jgi:4-amino-4-deoxy-L-arabinose transferase-like glycosyltransferase
MSAGPERGRAFVGRADRRAGVVVLMAFSAALLFFDFGAHVLATNDETRFPMMARDILARGHWLLPEINGTPMLNKPPLHAWLIALAAWPTGAVTQRTAALPSLLAALGLVAGTYWIGRRAFDADVGFTAGLIAVTTAGVFSLARSPVPDMTLSLAMVAAMGAFVAAEFEGRRGALTVFYLLVGIAFWIKGPVGILPLAIALAYEVATYGWSGPLRLASRAGLPVLALLVVTWSGLALGVGRAAMVDEVVMNDYVRAYFMAGPSGGRDLVEPLKHASTILLPWSLLLPVALGWALRGVEPTGRRGTRLALVWAAVVFVAVALSHRQRWRYYLPLCAPMALLLAAWVRNLRWHWRTPAFAAAWIIVAVGLAVGQTTLTARQSRATDWRAIAEKAAEIRGPLFALEAPELVFEFYLGRPVLVTPNYQTFAQLPEATYLLARDRNVAHFPASARVRELAAGLVAGRRFVLLIRE